MPASDTERRRLLESSPSRTLVLCAESDSDASDDGEEPGWWEQLVSSEFFAAFFSVLIVLNMFTMALQADYPEEDWPLGCKPGECYHPWMWLNLSFLGLFVLEIAARLSVHGAKTFFTGKEKAWNIFDFSIVAVGVVDVTVRFLHLGRKRGQAVTAACVLRMLRMLRVLRLLRTCRKLRMLARGLVESMSIVFWIFFLVLFLIYVYSIFFTDIVNQFSGDWGEDEAKIRSYFGGFFLSMFTLFQFVTLDNWTDVDELVIKKQPLLQLPIFSFIAINSFVILSLLTGVMADHMDQVRKDEDLEWQRERHTNFSRAKEYFQHFYWKEEAKEAFMTKQEWGEIFDDHFTTEAMDLGDIELKGIEALELFDIFDNDSDGRLRWPEFKSGILAYRHGLTTAGVLCLRARLMKLERQLAKSGGRPLQGSYQKPAPTNEVQQALSRAERRLTRVEQRLITFERAAREIMALYVPKQRRRSTVAMLTESFTPRTRHS